jgi:hypothetical protein
MGPWASSIPAHTTPIATKLSPRFPPILFLSPRLAEPVAPGLIGCLTEVRLGWWRCRRSIGHIKTPKVIS